MNSIITIDNEIQSDLERGIPPEQIQEATRKDCFYFAICSPSNSRLSRNAVGEKAIWDYELSLWFFKDEEKAELVAQEFSKNGRLFEIAKLPSKIVDGLLHGSPWQKKAIKLRCQYEIKHTEFKEKEKAFDQECEKYKMDKSYISGEAPIDLSDLELKKFNWLKKEQESLKKEEKELHKLRVKCERLEKRSPKKTLLTSGYDESEENDSVENEELKEELKKATANARRRALIHQLPEEEIVKDIRKQHPSLIDQAEEIAEKALLWAERYQTDNEVIVGGIPKTITDMQSLDARFAQLEASCQPCVIIHRADAQPISSKDLKHRLSGEVVIVDVDAAGQPKYLDAEKFWIGNTHKHIYKRIAFTNQPVTHDTYNLFTGFGIRPKQGKCDKILNHIKEVICGSDENSYTAFINLLSWQMKNIGRASRIILVLKSKEQQAGKGTLLEDILLVIYGNSGFKTSDMGQITGRFNDPIRGKAFVFLDEALFTGDIRLADALKSLATATVMSIETKGIPTVQLPIALNIFLATNHEDAAHIEEADARYWILEVSPHRVGDTEYFNKLYAEIEGGGREAFMDYLLNRDVKDFIPARDVPKDNESKKAMILTSINPYDARKWLEACCRSEILLGKKPLDNSSQLPWEPWIEGKEYDNCIFYAAYLEWQKSVKSPSEAKPTAANKFGELLTNVGLTQRKSGNTRYRTLPAPEECLKHIKEMIENARTK